MDTKDKILESAQRLIQQRGMNGFSYADIADEVGVRKASLHHHFATKTDLVEHLLARYQQQLQEYLGSLSGQTPGARLQGYISLYRHNFCEQRACLGGMLATEILTLSPSLQPALSRFFALQQQWLSQVLSEGQASGELALGSSAEQQASLLISALQGALMLSRGTDSDAMLEQTIDSLMAGLLRQQQDNNV